VENHIVTQSRDCMYVTEVYLWVVTHPAPEGVEKDSIGRRVVRDDGKGRIVVHDNGYDREDAARVVRYKA
jgi:anti-sigma regulatory factor (Ser/Thr protein kinase)